MNTDEYNFPEDYTLTDLYIASQECQACPLYANATQTVFGEGPKNAGIFLLGEQPGDQEDIAGRPFTGPAGQLLDRALQQAGIDRKDCYVTNAVKHFKWTPRGKRRLHERPNSSEIAACKPWWKAEVRIVKPQFLVCLGGTAARAVFDRVVKITEERGRLLDTAWCPQTLVTVHPSSLLREPDPGDREKAFHQFVADLALVIG